MLFMKAIFSRVRHPSHPGRGHGSLTCHMTKFEQSDWLRSENFINIMIKYTPRTTEVVGGYIGFTPLICPSILHAVSAL